MHAFLLNTTAFFLISISLGTITLTAQTGNDHHHHKSTDKYHGMKMTPEFLAAMKELRKTSIDEDEAEYGSWNSVIPDINGAAIGRILGMQTVHNVLLPSGKILMTSGSSWRNYKDIEYYPITQILLQQLVYSTYMTTHLETVLNLEPKPNGLIPEKLTITIWSIMRLYMTQQTIHSIEYHTLFQLMTQIKKITSFPATYFVAVTFNLQMVMHYLLEEHSIISLTEQAPIARTFLIGKKN
ncbi:MAG: hypothetical protein JKY54_09900 [Flavobacteriales bacterium]|nr:hypothetical protein [Flavobacteriales bacterium]